MSTIDVQPLEYKLIPLSKGKFAKVDNEDFEVISKYNWCVSNNSYAYNHNLGFMHRYIMKTPSGFDTDHINHNGFDNRKSNLRVCLTVENCRNQRPRSGKKSKFKGVFYSKTMNKWESSIKFESDKIKLGYFEYETHAARAYDKKAKELFGEFAYLNFKEDETI